MPIAGKGVYLLYLSLPVLKAVSVGRLGTRQFPAGHYLYAGSALGPGGLAARLGRHARQEKKMHWHIDYLRPFAKIERVWLQITGERAECQWAMAARRMPDARVLVPRFGSSDCRCPAHLTYYPERPQLGDFAAAAGIPFSQIQVLECDENGI